MNPASIGSGYGVEKRASHKEFRRKVLVEIN